MTARRSTRPAAPGLAPTAMARPALSMRRLVAGAWAVAGLLFSLPTWAEGPEWNQLSAAQRGVLAPLQSAWSAMDGQRKDKWVELANRYPSLAPAEQQRIQSRMADWSQLPPSQRGQARLNFQEARQVPAEERQARWEAYRSLSEDQRRQLAERAAQRDAQRSQPQSVLGVGPPAPATAVQSKANLVPTQPDPSVAPKTVSPTTVQAGVGATTRPIAQRPAPAAHQPPGQPKISTQPAFVDSQTLLPRRGAQAAETVELDESRKRRN